jgi:ubiquinone/menaquinone biosynthesis C-methylase UbiE
MASSIQINHPSVPIDHFATVQDYVVYLMHLRAYEQASAICKGRSVLDWGCNIGYGVVQLAKTAKRVGGVDTNVQCVHEARASYPRHANDIWLYDGRDLPFPEHEWDVVVSFQVIEHVQDMNSYLDAIIRALSNRGTALFTTPNREIRLDPGMKPWNEFHVTEFNAESLRTVLQGHFSHVQIYGMQGEREIADVERNRCLQAKRDALRKNAITARMRRIIPSNLKRTIRSVLSKPVPPQLPDEQLTQFSTSQLHYSQNGLDSALDLLAVCSHEEFNFGDFQEPR